VVLTVNKAAAKKAKKEAAVKKADEAAAAVKKAEEEAAAKKAEERLAMGDLGKAPRVLIYFNLDDQIDLYGMRCSGRLG
jgi:hypothetical protein